MNALCHPLSHHGLATSTAVKLQCYHRKLSEDSGLFHDVIKLGCIPGAGSDGTFYQVKASAMSVMELVHDALLYPRETKCVPLHVSF